MKNGKKSDQNKGGELPKRLPRNLGLLRLAGEGPNKHKSHQNPEGVDDLETSNITVKEEVHTESKEAGANSCENIFILVLGMKSPPAYPHLLKNGKEHAKK
ncbi:MAG: hypothetical protein NTV82_02495 [Candidatus Aminicenantes bacterium]|nr:hypothetical protein [Candidatus Aminicenantes bacterium]